MNIGLYFGSFNPPHLGHVAIALEAKKQFHLDEVWFVVSPQNPFKDSATLAPENHRLEMARLACHSHPELSVNDIEFQLPRPSYTIDTLEALQKRFNHHFSLIIGEDNWMSFSSWKSHDEILQRVDILVYHRNGFSSSTAPEGGNARFISGNLLDVSSTAIREKLREGKSVEGLIDPGVYAYILRYYLYQ